MRTRAAVIDAEFVSEENLCHRTMIVGQVGAL